MVFDLDTFAFKRGWGAYGHALSEITTDDKDRAYTANGPEPKEFKGAPHTQYFERWVGVCRRPFGQSH